MTILPKNWPEKTIYSPESVGVDTHISLLRLALFSNRPEDWDKISLCIKEKRVHSHLEIRKITPWLFYQGPKPHPLSKVKDSKGLENYGIFANQRILKDAELGEYAGEMRFLGDRTEEEGSYYDWVVWMNQGFWCIDASKISNEMMYVNDYRGLKKAPNACSKWMIHKGYYYFGYAALRDIERNEEIVVDYGKEWSKLYTTRCSG